MLLVFCFIASMVRNPCLVHRYLSQGNSQKSETARSCVVIELLVRKSGELCDWARCHDEASSPLSPNNTTASCLIFGTYFFNRPMTIRTLYQLCNFSGLTERSYLFKSSILAIQYSNLVYMKLNHF